MGLFSSDKEWYEETTTRKISFDELPESIKKVFRDAELKALKEEADYVRELPYNEVPAWAKKELK